MPFRGIGMCWAAQDHYCVQSCSLDTRKMHATWEVKDKLLNIQNGSPTVLTNLTN